MNTVSYLISESSIETARRVIASAVKAMPSLTCEISTPRAEMKTRYEMVEVAAGRFEAVATSRYPITVATLTVSYPTPEFNGWATQAIREGVAYTFIAREVEAINEAREYSEALKFGTCEHCRKAIARNTVYIVKHKVTGELLQVGGGCVAHYVPSELDRALRALSVTLSKFEAMASDCESCSFPNPKFVGFAEVTQAIVNMEGREFVPSNDKYGNPNYEATWRKVMQNAQDLRGLVEVQEIVLDTIRKGGAKFIEELQVFEAIGEVFSRGDVARFVALHHRAQSACSEAPKVEVPSGRYAVTGKVLNTKTEDGFYGLSHKMMVEVTTTEGAYRVWGTNPSGGFERGHIVTFTATFEPKEIGFGFFSRPSKSMRID